MLASRPVLAVTFYSFFAPGNFWSSILAVEVLPHFRPRLWAKALVPSRRAFRLVWFRNLWCIFFVFCMQESAKAALNMKGCQMTDRATQTEHAGPEVRHRGNTDTFLALSGTQKGIAHKYFLKECLNIYNYTLPNGARVLLNPYLKPISIHLFSLIESLSALYTQPQPTFPVSPRFKSIFHIVPELCPVSRWHISV